VALLNFWKYLPGLWNFERKLSNQQVQLGTLQVNKIYDEFYQAHEHGEYAHNPQQTFFRDYNFTWQNNAWHIYAANPKDGFELLHQITDVALAHTHFCNKDVYQFALLEVSQNIWRSTTKITGPSKNLAMATTYRRGA